MQYGRRGDEYFGDVGVYPGDLYKERNKGVDVYGWRLYVPTRRADVVVAKGGPNSKGIGMVTGAATSIADGIRQVEELVAECRALDAEDKKARHV
jgi:hypothetical protein